MENIMNFTKKSVAFTATLAVSTMILPILGAQAESIEMLSDAVQKQVALGIQAVPKARNTRSLMRGSNPFLSQVIDPTKVDFYGWRKHVESQARAAQRARNAAQTQVHDLQPMLVDELEPDNISGLNDTLSGGERINGFGTSANPRARVLGTLAPPREVLTNSLTVTEDDGAIPLANQSGVGSDFGAMQTSGSIGDGPHGSAGSGSGDFDFYSVDLPAGQRVTVNTDVTGGFDSVLFVYDATGEVIAANDDDGEGETLASKLTFTSPKAGTFYVMVAGFGEGTVMPGDPFDSASGLGVGSEGDYELLITTADDVDVYAIDLKAGDVIGATINGAGNRLTVFENGGFEVFGSSQDLSALYPVSSPLPGDGNAALAYTASVDARHYIAISGNEGNYDATLEVYRAGLENEPSGSVQTILLDFDGARVQTNVFGGSGGQRELTGLAGFLGGWGLGPNDEAALIDAIVEVVNENLRQDLNEHGFNEKFGIEIVDSRDAQVEFGDDQVSRIVIGGTRQESGIGTIGIASSIDPGNFGHEDDALVLLDLLSAPLPDPNSINTYLAENVENRIKFIAVALGNIIAHEAGHFIGNYHTDRSNEQANIMDEGGNLPNVIGAGVDQLLGTSDDVDVDFRLDDFTLSEGITGDEDTLNNSAFGLTVAD
jgi:hypothetical protein